jgi:hypothetical protein
MTEIRYLSTPGQPQQIEIDGERFVEFDAYADAIRQVETLVEKLREKQRTDASHAHQFAEMRELWENLPESLAMAPYAKSSEHFRKHALIVTGFCDTDIIDCGEHDVAIATAPLVAKMARKAHGYAIVTARGSLVTCSTPHSQSYRAMGKGKFEESKAKCLTWMHQTIGTHQ